jgi:hypothetical protein
MDMAKAATIYVKREWGWEHRTAQGQQFGASVGRSIEHVLGRPLTRAEARTARRGVVRITPVSDAVA